MKRPSFVLGVLSFFFALTAAANTAPTITPASPISLNQGDPATSTIVATVSDAEDSAGSLTVTATTVPAGITISSISNDNGTINAVVTAACDATSGENDIVLQVADSGGATATGTFIVYVRSTLPPGIPTISGATNGTGTNDQACPEEPLTLTASAPNATSYQWYVDGGPISGATSATYVATGAGSYTATASNECATSDQSFIAYNVQNPTPHRATLSVLSGSTSFCSGGSVTLWSDSATGIQWYKDGVAISGANNESYVATTSGSYTVILDALGCHTSASDPIVVTVSTAPLALTITAGTNGTGTNDEACPEQPLNLVAHDPGNSSLTNYQWYLGNDAIPGATSNQYSATAAGDYTIVATLNGCSTSSAVYTVQDPTPQKPTITVLSDSTTICTNVGGYGVLLQADSATGIQWYNGSFAISGANNQQLLATETGSYSVILNALGCHSQQSDPVFITVNVTPDAPTISATQNGTGTTDQACPEEPLVLTATDSNPDTTTYQWYQNNDTLNGETSKTYTATAVGDYTIVATSAAGCSVRSAVYTVQDPAPHAPFISFRNQDSSVTSLEICQATSQVIDSDSATGIQWYKDGVAIPGANAQSYTATQSGTYTAQLDALGCHSQFGRNVTLIVDALPSTPTITGTTNGTGTQDQACPEEPLTLTASSSGAQSYQWYSDNAPIGDGTATLVVTSVGNYSVTATNGTCTTSRSDTYVVQNPTPHAPFISFRDQDSSLTTLEVCDGTSVIIDSDSATGIQWYKDGVAIPGAGSQSYVATQSGTYTAQLDALGCHSQFGRNVTVIVDSMPPTPTISGTTNGTGAQDQACPQQPLTLTANSTGAVSYQWYNDVDVLSGETGSTLVVTSPATYYVTATNGTCTTSKSDGYVVQDPAPHAPFISFRNQDSSVTTLEICQGTSQIIDSDSATGIQWYKDGVAIAGARSQSYTATQSGTYTAQLDALGCDSQFGRNVTLTVDAMPSTPTISGATNGTGTQDQACPEEPLTLTASSTGAQSYQWYSDNAPIGDGTATLTVTSAGNYSVTATNGTCTTSRSATYVVQNPTPHAAFLSFRGQDSSVTSIAICQGNSVIIDTDSETGLVWYKDGVAFAPASASLTVTQSGVYTAQLDALGCHSQFSRNMTVVVNPVPTTPTISATTNGTGTEDQACPEEPLTLTATSTGAVSYQWYSDDAPVGDGSATLTVTSAGNYSVTATSGSCTTPRSATYVVQNPTPHKATLSVISGSATFCDGGSVTLWSDSATGIQWYKDGVAISGATQESYTTSAAGSYTVILDALGCHSSESDPIVVTVNSNPSAAITAPAVVISSSTGNSASVASAGAGATYTWSISGGTIASGSGTNAITFTAGSAGTLTLSVTVTNSNGCSDTQSASVSVVDPVTVKSVKPTAGSASGGDVITIKGTGFLSRATVTFGGVAATNVTVDSSTKIFATTPAHASGDVDVVVTNSNTASGTLTAGYTYKKK